MASCREVADLRCKPEGVAVGILSLLVVTQPHVPFGGRAEKQSDELVILDPPSRGDCLIEQLPRSALLAGGCCRDSQAAEHAGGYSLVARLLGRLERLPPEGLGLRKLRTPKRHVPGAGQGSGEGDFISRSGGSLSTLLEQLLGSGQVAAQQASGCRVRPWLFP